MTGEWSSWGLVAALLTILVVRIFWVLHNTGRPLSSQPVAKRRPMRTLVVLGSGTPPSASLNFSSSFLG